MFSNMSIKKKIIIIFSILFVLISGFLSLNYKHISLLDKNWNLYNTEATKRLVLIDAIKTDIGYSGFIHQFKNYIMRGEQKQLDKLNLLYEKFENDIRNYKKIGTLSPNENKALNTIENTINRYYKELQIAIKLKKEGKGIHQIDSIVKIDDGPATKAFNILLNEVKQTMQTYKKNFSMALDKTKLDIILLALMQISFILVYIFISKTIILPLKDFQEGLDKFFRYLNNEDVKVEPLKNKNGDEIGTMSQKTNIAIKSAIETHDELKYLRIQLENKLQITTKDLDTISKNKQEALEYGSIIMNSILPTKKDLDKIFTDYFILNNNNSLITQFYLLEKINENEYLYILINTREDDIKSIFTNILINAIIKKALVQLNSEEISTSWIMEYLNKNINISKNGFDGAIVYYNKTKNIIKYSGANLNLYYYQNNLFDMIRSDHTSIGIDKDSKYIETTIDIGEYIEIYLSTNDYIKNNFDIYELLSHFENNENQFELSLKKTKEDVIISGFQIDNKPKTIIEYEGEFRQDLVNQYMEMIEDNIDNMGLMSNISTNFVEQFQNILNYAKSKNKNNLEIYPFGSIVLQKTPDGTYSIETKNIVSLKDKQKIEPKLLEIQSLDKNGIKKRYRELRKSGENTHKKGGGVGFYEIAKRCNNIEYEFIQINEDRFEFRFVSFVSNKKG